MTIADFKNVIIGMAHSGTLNRVRNFDLLLERAANTLLQKVDPVDTMRITALTQTVHDDQYNYSLPSDYKRLIDLIPQDNRTNQDMAVRRMGLMFDLKKTVSSKQLSIESNAGTKYLRLNWRSRSPKTLNSMDSLTGNGTWSAVGSAANLALDTIYKQSGGGSIRFDLVATGDGIQNTSMTALDLSDENGVADFYVPIYLPTVPTSVTLTWGNDLTTNYWTGVAATTQADGTAFRVGWNTVKFSWSAATETGTVDATAIDSAKVTVAYGSAISNIRVDNITVSIGRPFDIKYYSKYLLTDTSGTWITRTTSDDDIIVLDNDAINLLSYETLKLVAQQVEGSDSSFDVQFSDAELQTLYTKYRKEYPSQAVKAVTQYGSSFSPNHRVRSWQR